MKLAISNIAWSHNHEQYYQLMLENGFSGLEIAPNKFGQEPYDHLGAAVTLKDELLNKHHLPVICMQSLLFGTEGLALFQSYEARTKLKKHLKQAILYAETVACPVLVFGNPKNRILRDPNLDYPVAVNFFREIGEFALLHNTCFCIEPNPVEYGTNFINTLTEAYDLVNDVASEGFGMIIDTGAMLLNQDKPQLALEVLSATKHIHASTPFLTPFSQEYTNYKKWLKQFVSMIKAAGYNGYISIEMANVSYKDISNSMALLHNLVK